jgi:hypothetical protein
MPLYKFESFKQIGTESWENTYNGNCESDAVAQVFATMIAAAEILMHSDQVFFTYVRVTPLPVVVNNYMTVIIAENGNEPAGNTGQLYPLFNVARCNLQKLSGRPDYKLYRGVIGENNSGDGVLGSTLQTLIESNLDALITIVGTDPYLVDGEGDPFSSVQCDQFIRQRDLHRRKRRNPSGGLVIP